MARQDVGIHAVDAQLGHGISVETGDPHALHLAYVHVRYDVVHFVGAERRTGPRVQREDEGTRGAQGEIVDAEHLLQFADVARGEQVEIVRGQLHGRIACRGFGWQGAQLQGQALGQVACADSRGVHVLQVLERGLDFLGFKLLDFFGEGGGDVGKRLAEETGFVEIVDQRCDERAVTQGQRADDELVEQVFA